MYFSLSARFSAATARLCFLRPAIQRLQSAPLSTAHNSTYGACSGRAPAASSPTLLSSAASGRMPLHSRFLH